MQRGRKLNTINEKNSFARSRLGLNNIFKSLGLEYLRELVFKIIHWEFGAHKSKPQSYCFSTIITEFGMIQSIIKKNVCAGRLKPNLTFWVRKEKLLTSCTWKFEHSKSKPEAEYCVLVGWDEKKPKFVSEGPGNEKNCSRSAISVRKLIVGTTRGYNRDW